MLQGVDLFSDLPEPATRFVEQGSIVLDPRSGSTVFRQGDRSDALYAIVDGAGFVRIAASSPASKVLMVEVFRRGSVFGEIGVIDGAPRTADAEVDGQVRLLKIPGTVFQEVMARSPALGQAMARLLCQRLRRTFSLVEAASFESLGVRLAHQLLYLAAVAGVRTEAGTRLSGRLRQSDLADLLGTTPRSIITVLNDWRARGLVSYDAARAVVTLRDEEALSHLVRRATQ